MSRLRIMALCALCAMTLWAAGPIGQANALPLALSGNGSGSVTPGSCGMTTCAATLNAGIIGKFIGKSTMTLTLAIAIANASNGNTGTCSTATGSGTITTANKSAITIETVGAVCNVADSSSPRTYNATYFITGGNAHFPGASGSGLFVTSIDNSNNAIVTINGGLNK